MNRESFKKPNFTLEKILLVLGGILATLCWISLVLGELSLFFRPLLWIITLIVIGSGFLWMKRNIKNLKMKKLEILALVIVIFLAGFHSFFTHDTFFSSRDEGVYANASILLSKYNSFKINLNLPPSFVLARNNTWLQPTFHFGYPAWLGLNYSLFGINGIRLSNFLLVIVTLLSIFMIAKLLGSEKAGLIACILLSLSYPFLWFWRRTVSENLVTALVWFGLFSTLLAIKKDNKKVLILSLFSFGFALHARNEPLFLLLILLALLFICSILAKKRWIIQYSFLILLPIFAHYLFYLFTFRPEEINNFTQLLFNIGLVKLQVPVLKDELPPVLQNALHLHLPEFTFHILSQYSLYFPIPFIIITPIFLFIKKLYRKCAYFVFLILILSPLFYTLMSPHVVYDQPWMLRRYLIGVFPLSFLALSFFIIQLTNKKMSAIIFALALVVSLTISFPLLFLSEYKGTVKNIGKIVQDIPKNSIIFTDRFIFTDYYEVDAPIFSVYDIPATRAYFDNIEETIIPEGANVYFITHENEWRNDQSDLEQFFPRASWELASRENFSFSRLVRTCELLKEYGMPGWVGRLPIDQAIQECSEIPSKIENLTTKVVVYRVNSRIVEDYLRKQSFLESYAKQNIFFQPESNYKLEDSSMVCLKHFCIIRYYLPRMSRDQEILLFAKPIEYPEEYNISITAEGENIRYSIFNFDTNVFNEIESKYVRDGNLNFDADTTYFQETYVYKNYINLKLESSSPIKIKDVQIQPREK